MGEAAETFDWKVYVRTFTGTLVEQQFTVKAASEAAAKLKAATVLGMHTRDLRAVPASIERPVERVTILSQEQGRTGGLKSYREKTARKLKILKDSRGDEIVTSQYVVQVVVSVDDGANVRPLKHIRALKAMLEPRFESWIDSAPDNVDLMEFTIKSRIDS
jgi:hypothetical protein